MIGDLHDCKFPSEPPLQPAYAIYCRDIMTAAIAWFALFYFIVKPSKIYQPSEEVLQIYLENGLTPRFYVPHVVTNWREYEQIQYVKYEKVQSV